MDLEGAKAGEEQEGGRVLVQPRLKTGEGGIGWDQQTGRRAHCKPPSWDLHPERGTEGDVSTLGDALALRHMSGHVSRGICAATLGFLNPAFLDVWSPFEQVVTMVANSPY